MGSLFDEWAVNGNAEKMEYGHGYSTRMYLRTMRLPESFSFLDVGCGNGWTVRMMAQYEECRRAVGIDRSPAMIDRANAMGGPKEEYAVAAMEEWDSQPFDIVFSMESLYYSTSVRAALSNVYSLLVPGGVFVCGTDFYTENTGTTTWKDRIGHTMHLLSEKQWLDMFKKAGFKTSTSRIRNPGQTIHWKRNHGTLFMTGVRPQNTKG